MKKIIVTLCICTMLILGLSGFTNTKGEKIYAETDDTYKLLFKEHTYILTFKDEKTGVCYIGTPNAITVRDNADGSPYTGDL